MIFQLNLAAVWVRTQPIILRDRFVSRTLLFPPNHSCAYPKQTMIPIF
jgi:hypothetical protein